MTNPMTNPDFESMPRKELLQYILANREDDAAFRIYMDRAQTLPNRVVWHPAPSSLEDMNNIPEVFREAVRREEELRRRKQEGQE
jgi:hypothetical protein